MSALVIGDSHGSIPMMREAMRVAQHLGASEVWSVGDYGFWPGASGREFLDANESMAETRGLIVKVAPGNHDDYDMIDAAPINEYGWHEVRDRIWAAPRGLVVEGPGGKLWLACGGAASIDGPGGVWQQIRGPVLEDMVTVDFFGQTGRVTAGTNLGGWWPQERITAEDIDRSISNAAGKKIDVVISHEVPHAVTFDGARDDWRLGTNQRLLMQRLIDAVQPRLHFGGHWHRWHDARLPHGGRSYTLSADMNPQQTQWVFIDDDGNVNIPEWHQGAALTREGLRKHKVDKASIRLFEPYGD